MTTNRLISVISGFTLAFATLAAPETARGLEVLAPYWAYQLQAGTFLAELRTFSGVTYHNVRIQAINVQQMQFSHSRGVNMEMLTNIVDPNQYLQPGMKVNPPRQGGGRAAPREREPEPEPDLTVGRNGAQWGAGTADARANAGDHRRAKADPPGAEGIDRVGQERRLQRHTGLGPGEADRV